MMKKAFLASVLFVGTGFSLEPVVEPISTKSFEVQASLGYSKYSKKYLGSTWHVKVNADYRVKYPFLVGVGALVSSSSDVFMIYPELRAKVRIPVVSTFKVDPYASTSVGYAENKKLKKKKLIAGFTIGFQPLYFTASEMHFGLDISYTLYSDSRFNAFRAGLVIGF